MTDVELAEKALDAFSDHLAVVDVQEAGAPELFAGTALAQADFVQITITCYRTPVRNERKSGVFQVSFTRDELDHVLSVLGAGPGGGINYSAFSKVRDVGERAGLA